MNLSLHSKLLLLLDKIKNRAKFKHVKRNIHDIADFEIYHKCNEYLVNEEDSNEAKEVRNTWHVFV